MYNGPWVAERFGATLPLKGEQPEALRGVPRANTGAGRAPRATDLSLPQYRLAELRRTAMRQFAGCDALLFPTAGKHYSLNEVRTQPVLSNSNLGYYTNFMNLLDMCGIALPGEETRAGLPFGVSLIGDRLQDARLMAIARHVEVILRGNGIPRRTTSVRPNPDTLDLVVCGAHMSGLPLNGQLRERDAVHVSSTQTAAGYRLFALAGGPPHRPALVRDAREGRAIDVEIWRIPAAHVASFMQLVPPPLGIGSVELADGTTLKGFICEHGGLEGAQDITHHGGWRRYLQATPPADGNDPS